ncbi:hypothetical protein ACWEKT_20965 [Nocardia takedensis]
MAGEFMAAIDSSLGPTYSQCLTRWLDAGENDARRRDAERDAAIEILVEAGLGRDVSKTIVRSHTAFARAAFGAGTPKPPHSRAAASLHTPGPGGGGIA